jgi:hypothetical protein
MANLKRTCGSCTKCCEGWLTGEALGHSFFPGSPCHFVTIGKGCTVYSKRPQDPCQSYKCNWLTNEDLPEWMKPDEVNAIVDFREADGILYMQVTEAGSVLESRVLSWLIQYALKNKYNFLWRINGGRNWIGDTEFNELMLKEKEVQK